MAIDGKSYSTIKVGNGTSVKIEYRDALPSTALLAKEYAAQGYPDRYAIFTERQSDGRLIGTRTREGRFENGIFLSVILRPSFFTSQLSAIGPISIAALAQAVESFTEKSIGISWATDLYCDGVKIGGTQIEGKLRDQFSYEYMIISFAVRMDEKNFPPRLCDMIKKVFEEGNPSVGVMMAKAVLENFFNAYLNIRSPEKSMEYYKRKFVLNGAKVRCISNGRRLPGRVAGLNPETNALTVRVSRSKTVEITKTSDVFIPKRIKIKPKSAAGGG